MNADWLNEWVCAVGDSIACVTNYVILFHFVLNMQPYSQFYCSRISWIELGCRLSVYFCKSFIRLSVCGGTMHDFYDFYECSCTNDTNCLNQKKTHSMWPVCQMHTQTNQSTHLCSSHSIGKQNMYSFNFSRYQKCVSMLVIRILFSYERHAGKPTIEKK